MNLAHRIQAKTDNGDTVIDFLIEVMNGLPRSRHGDERDGFKMCHRLGAARLLTRYGCSCKSTVAERDDAIGFIIDNPPEPPEPRPGSGSSTGSTFDITLAKKVKESTDDGASVVRFLINVMQGDLKAFGPHHSMAAARELLSRGFGKHAREEAALTSPSPRRSGVGRNPEEAGLGGSHSSFPNKPPLPQGEGWGEGETHDHQPTPTHTSNTDAHEHQPDPEEEEQEDWAKIWEEIEPIIEEAERISAEQPAPEPDPDNPPHVPDFSALDEAWENS